MRGSLDRIDSARALAFDLFFPFVDETTSRVDARLLQVLGLPTDVPYTGEFDKVLDEEENTRFDFYLEGSAEHRIFVRVELAARDFGACADSAAHRERLERHYRPHLSDYVDTRWLEHECFFRHSGILRSLSYLGRHPQSGVAFIYPKANESLVAAGEAIKKIAARSLAPRVAILYLESLVRRTLDAAQDDPALHAHFVKLKQKYVLEQR